ncbi:Protein of unknown function [Lactobacillus helveticus CIRM-BIA 953]|uniref:Uncharacterized protein n=1 Tax=Lactobacillus helveticus CIRM-BIA 953 TaxID=1226335 RepID=U4QF78_LACHE|nr:Protein of unknown function [Lactobacillus helveticus CIRM-BIA 953]CDI43340.1 Protein of unknown function [Lactobacillus helveticus CIRM-BIA 953]
MAKNQEVNEHES